MTAFRVTVSSTAVVRFLVGVVGLLIALHIASQYVLLVHGPTWGEELLARLDLEHEVSIPTWFSHSILLLAAVFLAIVAHAACRQQQRDRRYWTGLAILFLYLSIDEGASLHELLAEPVRKALDIQNSFFVLAWILPAGLLAALFGLVYFRFWWRLAPPVRWRFAVAAAVYLGGALGAEALSSAYAARYGVENFGMALVRVVEEGMEMIGVCILIAGALRQASLNSPRLELEFTSNEPPGTGGHPV